MQDSRSEAGRGGRGGGRAREERGGEDPKTVRNRGLSRLVGRRGGREKVSELGKV